MKRKAASLFMCAAAAAAAWADISAAIAGGTVWTSAVGAAVLLAASIFVTGRFLWRAAKAVFAAVLVVLTVQLALPTVGGAVAARWIAVGDIRLYSCGFIMLMLPFFARAVLTAGASLLRRCICAAVLLYTMVAVFMQPNLKVVLEMALGCLFFFLFLGVKGRFGQYRWLALPALFSLAVVGYILFRTGQAHVLLFAGALKLESFWPDGAAIRMTVLYLLLLAGLFWSAHRQQEPFAWGVTALTASAFLACFAVSLAAAAFSGQLQVADLPLFSGEPTVKLSSYALLGSVIALNLRSGARQRTDTTTAAPQ